MTTGFLVLSANMGGGTVPSSPIGGGVSTNNSTPMAALVVFGNNGLTGAQNGGVPVLSPNFGTLTTQAPTNVAPLSGTNNGNQRKNLVDMIFETKLRLMGLQNQEDIDKLMSVTPAHLKFRLMSDPNMTLLQFLELLQDSMSRSASPPSEPISVAAPSGVDPGSSVSAPNAPGPSQNGTVGQGSEASSADAEGIAQSAERIARKRNTVGRCYAGVADALQEHGVHLSGMSAYMAKDQLAANPNFEQVPLSEVRRGDILVHGKAPGHPHGHIAVALGNGMEASDHVQRLITGEGYGGTTVFRPKSNNAAQAA